MELIDDAPATATSLAMVRQESVASFADEGSVAIEELVERTNNTGGSGLRPGSHGSSGFDLDNSEEWDELLLSEAYHYTNNDESMDKFELPADDDGLDGSLHSMFSLNHSVHSTHSQSSKRPPLREILKQSSSRRMLMDSARQLSSRRLLASTGFSNRSMLETFKRTSSRSLLLPLKDKEQDELTPSNHSITFNRAASKRSLFSQQFQRCSSRSLLLDMQAGTNLLVVDNESDSNDEEDFLFDVHEEEELPKAQKTAAATTAPPPRPTSRPMMSVYQRSTSRRGMFLPANQKQGSSRRLHLARQISLSGRGMMPHPRQQKS